MSAAEYEPERHRLIAPLRAAARVESDAQTAQADAWDEGFAARAEYDLRRDVPTTWPDLNPYRAGRLAQGQPTPAETADEGLRVAVRRVLRHQELPEDDGAAAWMVGVHGGDTDLADDWREAYAEARAALAATADDEQGGAK